MFVGEGVRHERQGDTIIIIMDVFAVNTVRRVRLELKLISSNDLVGSFLGEDFREHGTVHFVRVPL